MDLVSRTIGGIVDQKFVLHNDLIARTINVGTSWTQLRLGMRVAINLNSVSADFTPKFYFGMCSGTTAVAGDQTPTNYFGFSFKQSISFTASTGYVSQLGGSAILPVKIVNGTETTGTAVGSLFMSTSVTVRNLFILEIIKGSPNYTFGLLHPSNSTGATTDKLLTDLTSTITTPGLMVVSNYAFDSNTLAFDEVAGGLNSANVYWNLDSRYIEVSELMWVKVA